MNKSQPLIFLFKAIVAGLAIAFVILILRPDLLGQKRPIVEILQSQTTESGLGYGPVSYAAAVEAAAPAVANIYTTKIITERANPFLATPSFVNFLVTSLRHANGWKTAWAQVSLLAKKVTC